MGASIYGHPDYTGMAPINPNGHYEPEWILDARDIHGLKELKFNPSRG